MPGVNHALLSSLTCSAVYSQTRTNSRTGAVASRNTAVVVWCSGYHICFTRRRSPVRSRAEPLFLCTFLRRLTPLASNISRIIHQLFLITTAFSVESIQRRTIKSQNSECRTRNTIKAVTNKNRRQRKQG